MKIIICTFLLCITVSVFGGPQELNGIVGKSIEFPAAVETSGNLIYSSKANAGVTIGDVTDGYFTPQNEKFRDRLQWHSSTGHFSLSELKLEDSGVYKVEKNDGQKSASFNLTVWIPVSKPHVMVTHNKYPCKLMCTVEGQE
ncbi:hypothetical protein ANANG_G00112810 [Anguilla anguilla]|uniref:Immunoglobulin subtype domain-containing protein n=1 Tax=Anguilla anguilla TaxID=7936 RepID=A0A9D3RZJ3_ANGAN|nr:hypothetical protein ANANG_G00112810 [Anguilla anguilla]